MSPESSQPKPTATWNPARGVWETSAESDALCGHSVPFLQTWPASGSMRNGSVWTPPTSAPRTSAAGSSSPPGLPLFKTPTSQLAVNGGSQHPDKRKAGGHGPTLADEVEHLLPTPTARLGDNTSRGADPARYKGPKSLNGRRSNLDDCIAAIEEQSPWLPSAPPKLLPTPTASNPNDGEDLQSWEARRQRNLAKGINGNGQGTPLSVAVRLLPTPTAQAHSRNSTANRTDPKPSTNTRSQTLLDVFWTGAPTDPPSPDGSTS